LESELEPELDCTLSLWLLMFADASRRTSKVVPMEIQQKEGRTMSMVAFEPIW
jgi:hypothetical protein